MATLMLIPPVEEGRQECSNGYEYNFQNCDTKRICWHRNATHSRRFNSKTVFVSIVESVGWNACQKINFLRAHIHWKSIKNISTEYITRFDECIYIATLFYCVRFCSFSKHMFECVTCCLQHATYYTATQRPFFPRSFIHWHQNRLRKNKMRKKSTSKDDYQTRPRIKSNLTNTSLSFLLFSCIFFYSSAALPIDVSPRCYLSLSFFSCFFVVSLFCVFHFRFFSYSITSTAITCNWFKRT